MFIYALFNNATDEAIYVGITQNPKDRYARHKSLLGKSLKIDLRLEILEEGEHLTSKDEFFWIENLKFLGCNLVNRRERESKANKLEEIVTFRVGPGTKDFIAKISKTTCIPKNLVLREALELGLTNMEEEQRSNRAKGLVDSEVHRSENSVLRAALEAGLKKLEKNEGLAV